MQYLDGGGADYSTSTTVHFSIGKVRFTRDALDSLAAQHTLPLVKPPVIYFFGVFVQIVVKADGEDATTEWVAENERDFQKHEDAANDWHTLEKSAHEQQHQKSDQETAPPAERGGQLQLLHQVGVVAACVVGTVCALVMLGLAEGHLLRLLGALCAARSAATLGNIADARAGNGSGAPGTSVCHVGGAVAFTAPRVADTAAGHIDAEPTAEVVAFSDAQSHDFTSSKC